MVETTTLIAASFSDSNNARNTLANGLGIAHRTLPMYAHVNFWMMNDLGATWDDTSARAVAAALRDQPGFRSYTLVRSGEWQVIAVTVFESEAALTAAMEAVVPLVHERVAPLATEPPARYSGPVLHHLAV